MKGSRISSAGRSKHFAWAIALFVLGALALVTWLRRAPNLEAEARTLANAIAEGDISKIYSYASPEEKEGLTENQVREAYRILVTEYIGEVSLAPGNWRLRDADAFHASGEASYRAGDGTTFLGSPTVYGDNKYVCTGVMMNLISTAGGYTMAKKNMRAVYSRLEILQKMTPKLEEAGITKYFNYTKNSWTTLRDAERLQLEAVSRIKQ